MQKSTDPIFKVSSAHGDATLVQKLSFQWPLPFIKRSQEPTLINFDQCGSLRKEDLLQDKLHALQNNYSEKAKNGATKPLLSALGSTFQIEIVQLVLSEIVMTIIGCIQPIIIKLLIDQIKLESSSETLYKGLGLVVAYCLNEMFERFGSLHKNLAKSVNGQKAKNVVRALIFKKITTISSATNKEFAEG